LQGFDLQNSGSPQAWGTSCLAIVWWHHYWLPEKHSHHLEENNKVTNNYCPWELHAAEYLKTWHIYYVITFVWSIEYIYQKVALQETKGIWVSMDGCRIRMSCAWSSGWISLCIRNLSYKYYSGASLCGLDCGGWWWVGDGIWKLKVSRVGDTKCKFYSNSKLMSENCSEVLLSYYLYASATNNS
jgi:hypothetical protein